MSGKSMSDPELLELVERELREKAVDPANLVFEITETAAIANMEEARAFADRLTALGCRFALDDFGAGFSSFYYLKYLPLNYLKIDGDFIKGLAPAPPTSSSCSRWSTSRAGMGMKTIAEFVEAPRDRGDAPREGRRLLPGLLPRAPAPRHRGVRLRAATLPRLRERRLSAAFSGSRRPTVGASAVGSAHVDAASERDRSAFRGCAGGGAP